MRFGGATAGLAAAKAGAVESFVGLASGEDFLRRGQSLTKLNGQLEGVAGDEFKRADESDGVHVVKEAEVSDAEDLALHFALAIGDDGAEAGFHFLDQCAGVEAFGDGNSGGRSGRRGGGEEGEAEGN